jgi:hypothetical protein
LRGREYFADLSCTGPNNYRRVEFGESSGDRLN